MQKTQHLIEFGQACGQGVIGPDFRLIAGECSDMGSLAARCRTQIENALARLGVQRQGRHKAGGILDKGLTAGEDMLGQGLAGGQIEMPGTLAPVDRDERFAPGHQLRFEVRARYARQRIETQTLAPALAHQRRGDAFGHIEHARRAGQELLTFCSRAATLSRAAAAWPGAVRALAFCATRHRLAFARVHH